MSQDKKTYITTVGQGIIMGIVEVIPGVSASTLALIMGIYDKFIDFLHEISDFMKTFVSMFLGRKSFSDVKTSFKEMNFGFGAFLLTGMAVGIGAFSHVMSYLLENEPVYTFAFFFGLILASIRVPFLQMSKITPKVWVTFIATSILFFVFLGLNPATNATNPSLFKIFISGFFAICAMVLPGVSGSFVLLLFGMYDFVIELIKNFTKFNVGTHEILSLAVLGLGVVLGFALFVRVIKMALSKFPEYLMSFLAGLMVASLRVLYPFGHSVADTNGKEHVQSIMLMPWEVPIQTLLTVIAIIVVTFFAVYGLNEKMTKQKFEL